MTRLTRLLLTTLALYNLALAADKQSAGAGLGMTDVSTYDTGYSLILHANKPFADVASNFGAEAVFSTTIADPSKNGRDLSVTTLAAYATWYFDLSLKVSIKPKVGLAYGKYSTTTSTTDISLSYGFKTAYPLEGDKSLYLDYTIIDADLNFDVSILSFGMLFPF